jgi:NAD(P)-dependent dehydrogenase (short-subunit alcohol dehydrogenase family)
MALEAARLGYPVAVHYHSAVAGAAETASKIRELGGKAEVFRADLMRPESSAKLVREVGDALGVVSCLINNASLFEHDRFDSMSWQSWRLHLELNLEAPLFLAQAFACAFADQTEIESGCIVNLLDQRVLRPTPDFFSYGLSKTALWAATRTMAQALSPRLRVNAIGPGPVLPSARQTSENFARQAEATPLGHPVGVQEICAALRLILESPSMTGQLIVLDGGQHLEWRGRGTDCE